MNGMVPVSPRRVTSATNTKINRHSTGEVHAEEGMAESSRAFFQPCASWAQDPQECLSFGVPVLSHQGSAFRVGWRVREVVVSLLWGMCLGETAASKILVFGLQPLLEFIR
jgi:hypothetical protein